ncbi:hypothetical protein HDU77_007451 [Chytriomyces hyalinus]|nr:hypothetical protein HDU77_007451 [Chytriomyces hyalinus]
MRVRRVNSTAKSAMGYARTEDSAAPAAAKPLRSNATEKVIIPYLATLPDELTVEVGELVQVVERFDDGWVKGRRVKTGHEGTFPVTKTQPQTHHEMHLTLIIASTALSILPTYALAEPGQFLAAIANSNPVPFSPSSPQPVHHLAGVHRNGPTSPISNSKHVVVDSFKNFLSSQKTNVGGPMAAVDGAAPAAASPSTSPLTSPESSTSSSSSVSSSSNALSTPVIIGIAVGSAVLVAVIAYLIMRILRSKKSNTKRTSTMSYLPSTSKDAGPYMSIKAQPVNSISGGRQSPTGRTGGEKVVIGYTPAISDELEIAVGDLVNVLESFDDGWMKGVNVRTGETGLFPAACLGYVPSPTGNDGALIV